MPDPLFFQFLRMELFSFNNKLRFKTKHDVFLDYQSCKKIYRKNSYRSWVNMHGFSYMEMEPLHGFVDPRLCYLCCQSSPNEEGREEWKRKLEFANEGGSEPH